jgi:AcrR family transcriptional regulator
MPRKKAARTDEEKEKLKERIIEEGRNLFVSKGSYGFSTHALAKKLKMSQSNLYNYFKSKRELYIAIRREDIRKLKTDIESIINSHQGGYIDLFKKIAVYYLDFASLERRRFQMMFAIPPPPLTSNKLGPIEKKYIRIDPIKPIREIVKKAMDSGEIIKNDPSQLTYMLYALFHGATAVERDLRWQLDIIEPLSEEMEEKALSSKEKIEKRIKRFRNFILDKMVSLLTG